MQKKIEKLRERIFQLLRKSGFNDRGINAVWTNTLATILYSNSHLSSIHLVCIWTTSTLALPDTRYGELDILMNQGGKLIEFIQYLRTIE
jgi:hypothetical protein